MDKPLVITTRDSTITVFAASFIVLLLNACYTLKVGLRSMEVPKKMLTIGRVAQQVGMRPSAIRYYEGQKILQPAVRGANGYRFYTDDAVKLLRFIRRAQSLGITLKEIKPLLHLAFQGQQPCSHVKQLAVRHLREINQKIGELEKLRNELRKVLRRKRARSHGTEVCPMIEGVTSPGISLNFT